MIPLRAFGPAIPRPPTRETLRAGAGAMLGLLLAAALEHALDLGATLLPPLGATAVLVMAVPNSPLAQPWSTMIGTAVAAAIAVPAGLLLPMPWAAAAAVTLALIAMSLLRALHPPAGAIALMTALAVQSGTPPLTLAAPLAAGTLTLIAAGMAWAALTGRHYPMRVAAPQAAPGHAALPASELEGLLARFRQSANMAPADLGRLLAAAQAEAARHRFDGTSCGDVMSRPLVSVSPAAPLSDVARLLAEGRFKTLPVTDPGGRLLGTIQQADVIDALLRRPGRRLTAAALMRPGTMEVAADLPVGALLHHLATRGPQAVAVMDGPRLLGMITRTDVLALLLAEQEAELHAAPAD